MNTAKEGKKRTLENIIDVGQCIISKEVRKVYREKLVLYADGVMKLNNTFVRKTIERQFAVALAKDFHKAMIVPYTMKIINIKYRNIRWKYTFREKYTV